MKNKHLAGVAAITLILLLSMGCKLGSVYVEVTTNTNKDAAIRTAESFKERKMDSQVFQGADKLYHVTIGPYMSSRNAEGIKKQKIAEGIIPATARVINNTTAEGWQQVYPITGTIPKPPGRGGPQPPTSPPKTTVRKDVEDDVKNNMKDDFKVYPPDKK